MGIAQIKEELLHKAEQESSGAKKEAEKQARELVLAAKERVEQLGKNLLSEAQRQAEMEHRKAVEAATFGSSTSLLKAKKEMMDVAVAEARKQLGSIPAETRKKHIHALLELAKKDIEVEHVLCNRKDMPFVQTYKAEEAPISGGLIAENKERTMRVDLSYETLFAAVVEESLAAVHDTLFASPTEGVHTEKPKQKRAKKA